MDKESTDFSRGLAHRIADSLSSGKPFYAFRLPHAREVSFIGEALEESGIHEGGFIISSFEGESTTLIPGSGSIQRVAREDSMPEPHTGRALHSAGVSHIRDTLLRLGEGKCVLSRLINGSLSRSPENIFTQLLLSRPDAFVFIFASPAHGYWLGASPETLLRSADGRMTTMSLAGTRPAGTSGPWDFKNTEEQQIVTDFIAHTLRESGLEVNVSEASTHRAGPVEHLMSVISAALPSEARNKEFLTRLLKRLSPTPALGGYPRETALRLINETENHSRGAYGGFCGPLRDFSDFDLFVNLRSIRFFPASGSYRQLVGGGITRFSSPEEEWAETEIKAKSLPI